MFPHCGETGFEAPIPEPKMAPKMGTIIQAFPEGPHGLKQHMFCTTKPDRNTMGMPSKSGLSTTMGFKILHYCFCVETTMKQPGKPQEPQNNNAQPLVSSHFIHSTAHAHNTVCCTNKAIVSLYLVRVMLACFAPRNHTDMQW